MAIIHYPMQLFKPHTPVKYNGKSHTVEYVTVRKDVVMVRLFGVRKEVDSTELSCEPTIVSVNQRERE